MDTQPQRKNEKWGTMTKEGLVVGRGDNKTVIPPDEVYRLATLHCTWKEMSEFYNVPVETFKYNFKELVAKGRAETRQRLRSAQIKLALSGNATMLIWLGKNMLGQTDAGEIDGENNAVLPWIEE